MKLKTTLILLIFSCLNSFGQEFTFKIHDKTLSDLIKIEDSLSSEKIENSSYYPAKNNQPITFRRKEEKIPDLIVQYTFEKDSTLSEILYEWDVYNFEKQSNNKKSEDFQKALIAKYKSLEKKIESVYGKSETEEGSLNDISLTNTREGLKKKNIWKPNDSTEIEMYTVLSNFHKKRGMVETNPTHRIRLYVKNKSERLKPKTPKLSQARIDSLDQLSKSFFTTLGTKNIAATKKYLSEIIKDKVTDEQIQGLMDNIDTNRGFELVYSGIQMNFSGKVFALLQYKYADNQSKPTNEIIKIIFDEKNKILGIQPMTRKLISTD